MGVPLGGSLWLPGLENVSCGPQIHAPLFLSNRGSASQPKPCSPSSFQKVAAAEVVGGEGASRKVLSGPAEWPALGPCALPSSCRLDGNVPEAAWDWRLEDGAVRAEDTGSLASMVPELQSWPQTAQPRLFWKGEISLSLA